MTKHRDPRYANLSARDANILDSIEGEALLFGATPDQVEAAQNMYLRWAEKDWRAAEIVAYEMVHVTATVRPMIAKAVELHGFSENSEMVRQQVEAFIAERVARQAFPQGAGAVHRRLQQASEPA